MDCMFVCMRVRHQEDGGLQWKVQKKGVPAGNFHSSLPRCGLLSGQSRRASRKEIKGNHPYSFSLVCLTAFMPACVPWAMFMLCPARDRIDSPTQHCALIQNLSRSGKPELQSHSVSLLRIRPYGLWQHSHGCLNRPKIASLRSAEKHVHPRFYTGPHQQVVGSIHRTSAAGEDFAKVLRVGEVMVELQQMSKGRNSA